MKNDEMSGINYPAGVTQRTMRSGGPPQGRSSGSSHALGTYPCFQAIPESQPVLPCLLRRLLQKNKAEVCPPLNYSCILPRIVQILPEINGDQHSTTSLC